MYHAFVNKIAIKIYNLQKVTDFSKHKASTPNLQINTSTFLQDIAIHFINKPKPSAFPHRTTSQKRKTLCKKTSNRIRHPTHSRLKKKKQPIPPSNPVNQTRAQQQRIVQRTAAKVARALELSKERNTETSAIASFPLFFYPSSRRRHTCIH